MNEEIQQLPDFIVTPPQAVQFRLYYDENGKVITYTCEHLEGNFVLVDAQTFAEARQDVTVVDGKVVPRSNTISVPKLKLSTTGTATLLEDVSIVVKEQSKDTQLWELTYYEIK